MSQLLSKIHWLLILMFLWFAWGDYNEFVESEQSRANDEQTLNLQLSRTQKKVSEIKVYKKNLERSRSKLRQVRSQINSISDRLPSEKNETKLLNFLSDQADRIRLIDSSFKPLAEKNKNLYFVEQYEVIAAGNYQQFLVFLEKLNDQERIYNIDFMELRAVRDLGQSKAKRRTRSQKFQLLESKIVLETYRFNKRAFNSELKSEEKR